MRRAVIITVVFSFLFLSSGRTGYSLDRKEAIRQYLTSINPVLTSVQITSRNLSQRLLSLDEGVKQMQGYINSMRSVTPPEFMARQHKMILLSFKKFRLGFYMLSHDNKPLSVTLVGRGADLLRAAIRDVVELGKKEGIIKKNAEQKNK